MVVVVAMADVHRCIVEADGLYVGCAVGLEQGNCGLIEHECE